jgi:hypothetical protein
MELGVGCPFDATIDRFWREVNLTIDFVGLKEPG